MEELTVFSAKNLEDRLTSLYRYGVHEAGYAESDVDAMLHALDFPALARAIRHNAETVHACTLNTTVPGIPRYRGRELFGTRAARLLIIPGEETPESAIVSRYHELWTLEYGEMLITSCLDVKFGCPFWGNLEISYREPGRYPWESGVRLNLAELTRNLRLMCLPVYQGKVPVYEM